VAHRKVASKETLYLFKLLYPIMSFIQGVPKLTLDILKADSLANLKTIFPQRKCRGTNSFRVIIFENKEFFAN